jgi:hypothetical protein
MTNGCSGPSDARPSSPSRAQRWYDRALNGGPAAGAPDDPHRLAPVARPGAVLAPDVFRPSKAGRVAVLVRYLSFAIVGAAGCVLAIAGVSAAPVMLAVAGMALHVAADVLTLCRFQRTLR